jgi:methyl-accepting chemotaxis protein
MNWYRSLRLGSQLILAFVAVALVAAALGLTGIVGLRKIDDADTRMYEKAAVPLGYMAVINTNFNRVRVALAKAVDLKEDSEVAKAAGRVHELEAGVDKNV